MTDMTIKRPGWVTFASIIMFLVGGTNLVWAIEALSNAAWLQEISSGDFGTQFTTWAIVDLVLALVALGASYSIWKGGKIGFWIGIIAASLSAVRAFLFFPRIPFGALTIIAIDILILYGLSTNAEYFGY